MENTRILRIAPQDAQKGDVLKTGKVIEQVQILANYTNLWTGNGSELVRLAHGSIVTVQR